MVEYLWHGVLPENNEEARKVRIKAPQYTIIEELLYQKGFMTSWLKWIDKASGKEALREMHVGSVGVHEGVRALTGKYFERAFSGPASTKTQ